MKRLKDAMWLASMLTTVVSCGCSGGGAPNGKATVIGTVTYEGSPLKRGTVTFSGKTNLSGMSAIDAHGRYRMQLFPGEYSVAIRCEEPGETVSNGVYIPARSLIPDRYCDLQTSGLSAVVGQGRNEHHFELQP